MSQQWRVECDACGKDISDNLRMHSQIPRGEIGEVEDKDIVEAVREDGATAARCNNCGEVRLVGN